MNVIESQPLELAVRRQRLLERLAHFRQRVRAHLLVEGAARVVGEAVVFAIVSLLLDRWLRLSLPMRLIGLAAAVAFICYESWRHILIPLRIKLTPVGLAAALDRAAMSSGGNGAGPAGALRLAPRIAAVLELPGLLEGPYPPSPAMVERAVLRSHESLGEVEFSHRLNRRRMRGAAVAIAGFVLVFVSLAVAFPETTRLWARRWFLGSGEPWPQRTYLQVAGLTDGRIVVARGEPYVLRVSAMDGAAVPDSVSIRHREKRGGRASAVMKVFGPNDFRYDFSSIQGPLEVELRGGDDYFGPFVIEPVDRPRIVQLQLAAQHPTQARPEIHSFSGRDSETSFLTRTRLALTFAADVPIAEARLTSSAPHPGHAELRRLDERWFAVEWIHEQPVQLQIELTGAGSGLTSLPTPIAIGLKNDQAPRVTLQYAGVRQRITPRARIPFTVQARDDYGIANIDLAIRAEMVDPEEPTKFQARDSSIALASAAGPAEAMGELDVQLQHLLDVAALELAPGSLMSATALAADACYTGAQTGRSRTVTFRVVRPEELFREILLRQQAERAKFRRQIEEAQKIRDALQVLVSQEAAAAVVRQHRSLQREVWRITNALAESLTEMRLNALGSPEAYELMERTIIEALRSLHDDLLTPQRDALDSLGRLDDRARVSEASSRQEEIIGRMGDILKAMAQWDSFVDVLNQLNEIIRLEEQVKQSADQLRRRQTEGLFDE